MQLALIYYSIAHWALPCPGAAPTSSRAPAPTVPFLIKAPPRPASARTPLSVHSSAAAGSLGGRRRKAPARRPRGGTDRWAPRRRAPLVPSRASRASCLASPAEVLGPGRQDASSPSSTAPAAVVGGTVPAAEEGGTLGAANESGTVVAAEEGGRGGRHLGHGGPVTLA